MKTPILFKTIDNIYLYSISKKQIIIVNEILYELIRSYLKYPNLRYDDIVKMNSYKKYKKTDLIYNFKKFAFIKEAGFLEEQEYKIKEIDPKLIEKKFFNSNYISFAITDKCNFRCKYCTYGDLYQDSNSSRVKKDIDFITAKKILDNTILKNAHSNRTDEFGISFYGGEPLMKFNLIEKIVSYVTQKCSHLNLKFFMTTNGTLLNKYMDFLVYNNFNLLISLDGNEENNSYRVYKNGRSSYKKVFTNLKKLKTKYPDYFNTNVEFNTVLHSKNNRYISNLNKYFKDNFNKFSALSVLRSTGVKESKKNEFNVIAGRRIKTEAEKFRDFDHNKILELYCDYKKISLVRLKEDNLINNNNDSYTVNATCIPFDVKTFITNEGNILPCEKVSYNYVLGKVKKNSLDIDFNEISKKYKKLSERVLKKCNTCYKIDCDKCMFSMELNGKLNCVSYISKKSFTNMLIKQLSKTENNNSLKI